MNVKLYAYWATVEISTTYLLLRGISSQAQMLAFLTSHGMAVFTTYLIFTAVIGADHRLRGDVMRPGFMLFLLAVTLVPVVGPAVTLALILFLRFFPLYPVRAEIFARINRDVLTVLQKRMGGRTIPVTEALLIRGLPRDDSVRMVSIIGEMEWQAAKSSILRYVIRLSPYANVVLMAIDMLQKKLDALLAEIARLAPEAENDAAVARRVAFLYHEVPFLDLCDPMMKAFYRKKACAFARKAYELGGRQEGDALLLVRYLLESDRMAEALAVYRDVRAGGEYFFPQWIAYELEFAVRQEDREALDNLDLLIATGGGVFIPERVKEAARAWKMALTSAWL